MKPMSNLTLKHVVEYIESTRQLSRGIGESIIPPHTVGHGGYGIVEEPCVVHLRMPPLTILPPRDNTIRRYYD